MSAFVWGVSFTIEFAIGTLILVGLFKGVWETAVNSKGLFWALGWSAYAMSFANFMRAMGDSSPAFGVVAQGAQVLFHGCVLSYIAIYMINHWQEQKR